MRAMVYINICECITRNPPTLPSFIKKTAPTVGGAPPTVCVVEQQLQYAASLHLYSVQSGPPCRQAHTMQSCGHVLVVLCAAACVTVPLSCLSEASISIPRNKQQQTLLALVRQASAIQHQKSNPRHNVLLQEQSSHNLPDRVNWIKRAGGDPDVAGVKGHPASPEEAGQQEELSTGLQQVGASLATNFLRHARSGTRPYDVPKIGKYKIRNM